MDKFVILILALAFSIQCYNEDENDIDSSAINIKGITMVAPPKPFPADPIPSIKNTNANWIAVVPYAYTPKNQANVFYGNKLHWWGEGEEGIRESIILAKQESISVMVKPQVYIPGSWVGDMDFDTEGEWMQWENDYRNYILLFAKISAEENADMLCIGTEYKIAIQKREQFWRKLIIEVKEIFKGKVVYSANWDAFENVPFWDALDFVGVSSYFPLSNSKTPSVNELKLAWNPIVRRMEKFSKKINKQILFTEFGYLTVNHCAYKAWELEAIIPQLDINQQAQANAFEALFSVFWNKDFWAGGFIWKWFPNMQGHEGYPEKDYTPQGKISESIISNWYALK